jgi:hypothetical protein
MHVSRSEFFTGIGIGICAGGLIHMALTVLTPILNIPDVLESATTNECVHVINYDSRDSYTCENLPEKYNHIWVR